MRAMRCNLGHVLCAALFALQCSSVFALSVTPTSEEMRADDPTELARRAAATATTSKREKDSSADAKTITAGSEQDARAAEILAMRSAPRVNDEPGFKPTGLAPASAVGLTPKGSALLFGGSILVLLGVGVWAMWYFSRKFNRERVRRSFSSTK